MADNVVRIRAEVVWTNKRAIRALAILAETLESVGEDFSYRDDVQRALRACRYLGKHVRVQSNVIRLGEPGG